MHTKKKFKIDYGLILILLALAAISIISINSAQKMLGSRADNFVLKQCIWYIIGSIAALTLTFVRNDNLLKYIKYLYVAGIISLILLLLFGKTIHWFN